MKINEKKLLVTFSFILLIGTVLLGVTACEPCISVKVVNGTDQVLNIYLEEERTGNSVRKGSIKPGEHIDLQCLEEMSWYFTITAKNEQDETVYSREFDYDELQDDYQCKVVIKLPKESPVSDNTTPKE